MMASSVVVVRNENVQQKMNKSVIQKTRSWSVCVRLVGHRVINDLNPYIVYKIETWIQYSGKQVKVAKVLRRFSDFRAMYKGLQRARGDKFEVRVDEVLRLLPDFHAMYKELKHAKSGKSGLPRLPSRLSFHSTQNRQSLLEQFLSKLLVLHPDWNEISVLRRFILGDASLPSHAICMALETIEEEGDTYDSWNSTWF